MRIIVIANCHAISLARAFALGAKNVQVDFIDLNFLSRRNEQDLISEIYNNLSDDLIVFSFYTTKRLSPVSTEELMPILGDRLKTFTNIRFDGLHPDITYLGPIDGRRHSMLGTYHSKLILFAFAKGLSFSDCLKLFDYKVYERLGYFELYEGSKQTLLARDRFCDIKFASKFFGMVRTELTLYTFNHPTGRVIQMLTKALCEAGGIEFVDFDSHYSINELSNSYVWPIYDEIAEFHCLPYRTPQYFLKIQSFASRSFSRDQMVRGSYDVYS